MAARLRYGTSPFHSLLSSWKMGDFLFELVCINIISVRVAMPCANVREGKEERAVAKAGRAEACLLDFGIAKFPFTTSCTNARVSTLIVSHPF